ncbi:MAG: cyclic nucleotide-binding domain-containing protein [Bacteroidetes bacterium]|nr:cyclic nucleotide-binding domain-containing protein [Bacteroidota bacterium]
MTIIKHNDKIKYQISLLKSIALFSGTDENILKEFALKCKEITLEQGDTLFRKGDDQRALYAIKDGKVIIHNEGYEFATLGKNKFFGEYSLIDSSTRSASVTALVKTELLKLDQVDFNKISENKPEVTKAILKSLINRLRSYNELQEELSKNNFKIEKQRFELQKANDTKDKFFSIIAHDLRNPFSTIINLSDLLTTNYNDFDDSRRQFFISQISEFSNKAFNLLENLLQWSRSQTGRLKVSINKTDISEIINDNIELVEATALHKNITIQSYVKPDTFVMTDENMTSTVIRNLITNAIKFTHKNGKITILSEEQNRHINIKVIDNGVGIEEKNILKLFKIASNPSSVGTSNETGTGLGLILCKEFIHACKGNIWVESEINKGASFIFSLPKSD